MNQNSLSAMEKKLQQKKAERQATVEKIVSSEFTRLSKALKKRFGREFDTIRNDMEEEVESIRSALKWSRLRNLLIVSLICISVSLGLGLGSWGAIRHLSNKITDQTQTLEQIEAKRRSLTADLQKQRHSLGLLPVQVKVVGNQIWLNNQPKVFESEGIWVVEVK